MKRPVVILAIVAILAAIAVVATPWLLSSDIVKQRIAARIVELTGLETTLKGTPRLSFLPFLGIKLKDVVIANPPNMVLLYGDDPLVSMEALKGNLKLLPAIFGRPELANFQLIRPRFNLKVTRQGKVNWYSSQGSFSRLLMAAKNRTDASVPLTPLRLGNFEIFNGTISYQNDRLGKTVEITSLNLKISWPDTNSAASMTGSMVWQGEVVKIALRAKDPLALLVEGASDVVLNIKSNPLYARFEGRADMNIRSQFTGTTNISSPSVRQFLDWVGYDLSPGSTPGELNINSNLVATTSNWKFQDAKVSLDGNSGTGFMEVAVSDQKHIGLTGTLAFDSLNFDSYFQAVLKGSGNTVSATEIAKIGLIDEFDLDLRFSAKSASLGSLSLTSMAATAQARDGNLILDVGEATMFGGMIQAQLQASKENGVPAGEAKLNLVDIELEQLSRLVSPEGIKIIGKGTATILLKSRGKNVSELVRRLNGSATVTATSGQLEGINLAEIAIDGQNAIILDNTKVLARKTDFTRLNIGLHIANGIAFFVDTKIEGPRLLAEIGGKADLWRRSLAMNGRVLLSKSEAPDEANPADITHNIPFFVGGTLDAPLFAPDLFSDRLGAAANGG